jgi:hypothetical protein
MIDDRALESFALFNPALTAAVLASAATAHDSRAGDGMPVALAFLVVPLVLHAPARQALPGNAAARLASWLQSNPEVRASFPRVAAAYVPVTREGLRAGLRTGALQRDRDRLTGRLRSVPDGVSADVLAALNKARLVGRWLSAAGGPAITYRLFGVRP